MFSSLRLLVVLSIKAELYEVSTHFTVDNCLNFGDELTSQIHNAYTIGPIPQRSMMLND